MRKIILSLLKCPVCQKGDLELKHVRTAFFIVKNKHKEECVEQGLVRCSACHARFPIIEEIPVLLPQEMMSPEEIRFLNEYDESQKTDIVEYTPPTPEQRFERMKALLEKDPFYREESYPDEKSKTWIRNEVEYELRYAHLKDKYVKSLSHKLKKQPKAILDIGGGQGGTLACFHQEFKPEVAILIDLDDRFTPIAKMRDERIDVIRGDGTNMPFKDKVFDLTISNGCLEHVREWPLMLAEIQRTGNETYLSYIPNGAFPWEIGHLSAPLVTWLPKKAARLVCFCWHKILRNKQYTFELIDHLLDYTNFVPSRRVEKECRRLGIEPSNMFTTYVMEAAKATYHHTYGRYVQFLGRHPWMLKLVTGMLTAIHIEPIVHYYLYHPDKRRV